jgi:hypothetical protein
MFTASEKTKLVKETGEYKQYVYYHCSKKKKESHCNQRPLTLSQLEFQIEQLITNYSILPQFETWAITALEKEKEKKFNDTSLKKQMIEISKHDTEKQLENLTRMRYKELIDDDTFVKEQRELKNSLIKLSHQLSENFLCAEEYIEETKKVFQFARYVASSFLNGGSHEKRQILLSLGSNYTINDKKLFVEAFKWLIPIEKNYPSLRDEYVRLELEENFSPQRRNTPLDTINLSWRGTVQDVRTVIENLGDVNIYIPSFTDKGEIIISTSQAP